MDPGVVGGQEEGFQGAARGALHAPDQPLPALRHPRGLGALLAIKRDQVDPRPRVRDVVLLGVQPHEPRHVALLLEVRLHLGPGRAANVLEDDDWRAVVLHPLHHAPERLPGLSLRIDVLLLVVEVAVIDTGRAGNEEVHIPRHVHKRSVGGERLFAPELTDVPEEDWRREIALDVALLVVLDLAAEDVLDLKAQLALVLAGLREHLQGKQRALRPAAHGRHAKRPLEVPNKLLELRAPPNHVRKHGLRLGYHREFRGSRLLLRFGWALRSRGSASPDRGNRLPRALKLLIRSLFARAGDARRGLSLGDALRPERLEQGLDGWFLTASLQRVVSAAR
mmetsp:Transcript_14813/g.35286  ORF Transcript_14813/g.35286 Transcript_14813/m.35286 type:complete len:337 (-) Transcript_14813:390-1400(-)